MTIDAEIKNIAKCLFDIEISMCQLSAYQEGLDKTVGLPYRSEWSGMDVNAQQYWINEARKQIKESGIRIKGNYSKEC